MNPLINPQEPNDILVELDHVKKYFPVQKNILDQVFAGHLDYVKAVDDVSFKIQRGEAFGLAGESGSGKTTLGRLAIGLEKVTSGKVFFNGINLAEQDNESIRLLRKNMQVIFQDPMASLNPRMTLGNAVMQGLKIHYPETANEHRKIVESLFERVGLTPPSFYLNKFPHQISGGQRQRVVIARALVTKPDLVLADEPVAMADVSVRALLLDLMIQLKQEFELTYLFITHDLATAKYICDRIGILYLGKLVEIGKLKVIFQNPLHPYTRALLAAVPVPDPAKRRKDPMPEGEIPNPINPPSGCYFHPRCPIARPDCAQIEPPLEEKGGDHQVACRYA